jgi:protein required for attachment to host cells
MVMKRACIAIVDATRARLYAYQHDVADDPNEQLREVVDFANPARHLRASELFSETRPGSDRSAMRNSGHTHDDHRDAHIEKMDLEFAKRIVSEIDRIVRDYAFGHVIMVASPKMLGDLRKVDGVLHRAELILDEIPRDLAKLTSPQLHDHLARLKLIAPRPRLAFAQRP